MIGTTQGERLEPGARQQAHPAARRDRRDDGQRPRPERLGQLACEGVERALARRGLGVGDMGNQRIELRSTFGGVDRRDGAVVGRVGGEAIDRLGRHCDQPASAQAGRSFGDRLRIGASKAGMAVRLAHELETGGDRLARGLVYI